MRGINIGYVKTLQINLQSIIVLINIKSPNIIIPRNSIIETNQTGLFNNTLIDIIPMEIESSTLINSVNVFSSDCLNSKMICHNFYLKGNRGLNYDDLIRAATRISQRFDDPRFFNLCYLFLQNIIDISDDMIISVNNISYIISIFFDILDIFLVRYII